MPEQKSSRVVWKGDGLSFEATLGSGYELEVGSPPDAEAASPMELLLAGVAGCTAMDIVHVLRKMRQPFSGLEVEISGVRAEEYPMVYTDVTLLYVVAGEGVDPAAVERAIELSMTTYCSASIIFKRAGVKVTTDYRIEPSREAVVV